MEKQAPNDKAAQMRLMEAAYLKMDQALKATGRPIVYSLCQYGWDAVWEWGPKVGANSWRTTGDIQANWQSIYSLLNEQAGLSKYAAPGHWNDPDMLEVGNGKLTHGGEPHPLFHVGHAGRPVAGRQRPAQHDAGGQVHPHQPRRHRHRPGQAGPRGNARLFRRRS